MQNIRSTICRATVNRVMQTLRSRSTALSLAYKTYGPSPTPKNKPILVLHDCLGTKQNWDSICRKLTALSQKTVIAVDARNHGDSPYCDTHDYTSLADDVLKLISHFVLEDCIIIGHSMGGRTAMMLALQEPLLVSSLIVVDISPVSTSSYMEITLPEIIDTMMNINFKGLDLKQAKVAAKKILLNHALFESKAETEAILMNIGKLPDKTIGWKYNLKVLKEQIGNIATFPNMGKRTFSGPTLFLAGKMSFCIPTDDFPKIQKIFPEARLLYIDDVRHNVHVEDPDGFLKAVLTFFENNKLIKPETITKS
ncbi:hypothetical protein PYW08_008337 [Mythimna loreyi]|uniref:Uncharacterized protein n=1 Tax=Mythimna loreyi TaxID=667449 RepID=A0ACC2QC26_9NEOP|nr:hypothetical protein PYW08_008337 [Mythimna loreyi]